MRERKYIKFRIDMYEDTKFKIIDMKPERDLIHYVWTRIVALAGKVNLMGELYMSKNLPYTIETLAIEFNRDIDSIKLALDVFRQLEMLEFTKENIYRVKNFAKHQNIKVKEKIESKNKEEDPKKNEIKETHINKILGINIQDAKYENIKDKNELVDFKSKSIDNLEITKGATNKVDNTITKEKIDNDSKDNISSNNSQNSIPILLETKKKKSNRKRKKDKLFDINVEEETEDKPLISFYDEEERTLGAGESIVSAWAF